MAAGSAHGVPATGSTTGVGGRAWRASRRLLGRDWPVAYLFAAPLLILLFGLIGYPLLSAVRLSFLDSVGRGERGFVGFDNYVRVWNNSTYRTMLVVTARFAALSLIGQATLGMIAALLIQRVAHSWRGLVTGLLLLPWVLPEVVTALTWRWFFNPILGPLNKGLFALGLSDPADPIVWFDPDLALYSVSFVNIWRGTPFFALILLAGLQAIDTALYDAASVDGADAWQRFRHVTLPGLRYVLAVGALLSILFSLSAFTLVSIMTNGGPTNATRIFPLFVSSSPLGTAARRSAAAALSIAPFLLALIALLGILLRSGDQPMPPRRSQLARAWGTLIRPLGWVLKLPLFLLDETISGIARAFRALGSRYTPRTFAGWVWRERLAALGIALPLGLLLLLALGPFYLIVITAFKTNTQITSFRNPLWPEPWSLQQFAFILERTDFTTWFRNTVIISLTNCLVSVLAAALGAYALARLRWRGGNLIATAILGTALVPPVLFLIPLFLLLSQFKLTNTLWSLVVSYPTFSMPMACWLLLGYFRSIPEELEEAALLDGCSHLQTFFRIILPLSWPAIAAVALFTVAQSWNELMFAGFFLRSEANWTLPMGLARMVTGDVVPYGRMFAASILMALPVTAFAILGQRAMISGLTAGAVKG
jgi:multiple sugar transport system permease protein